MVIVEPITPSPQVFPCASSSNEINGREFRRGVRHRPDQGALLRHGKVNIPIAEGEPADFAPLVNKDLAVYDLALGGGGSEREGVFQTLWVEWVPFRDQSLTGEKEEKAWKFWQVSRACGAVIFNACGSHNTESWNSLRDDMDERLAADEKLSPPLHEALRHLVSFHEQLCAQAAHQVGMTCDLECLRMVVLRDTILPDLQKSFTQIFAVADANDWEKNGWVLCCKQDHAARYGLTEDMERLTIQRHATWVAWRAHVKDSAQVIYPAIWKARTIAEIRAKTAN